LEEQRRQLALALQPQQMGVQLAQLFRNNGPARPPLCHILDMKYEPDAHCTILYQLDNRLLIGTLHWQATEQSVPRNARLLAPLGMQVYPFELDPSLPGLASTLDEETMRQALTRSLPLCQFGNMRVVRCQVTPLRYRPGKRCTLRLHVWLRAPHTGAITAHTYFGKLYHSVTKAQAVHAEMQLLLAATAMQAQHLQVAQPVAFLPELPLVLQAPVQGTALDLLLSHPERMTNTGAARANTAVLAAAAALAELHQLPITSERLRPVGSDLQKLIRRLPVVARFDPTLGASMAELAGALAASLEQLPRWGETLGVVHGDCKPSQFLIGNGPTALLDFDHCGMADPATDVGMFLATLRQLNVFQALKTGRALLWLEEMERHFLQAYTATGRLSNSVAEDFGRRATWYQALALLRKALRAFARSPRSPVPAALMTQGVRCLAELTFT
jgi:aminoglycoside phosphotransferase (APT) family kinase protein